LKSTSEEPAVIDETRLTRKSEHYAISTSNAVADRILMEVASHYQANVMSKMTALKPHDLPKRYTGSEPVLAMSKVDGEGVMVYFEAGRSFGALQQRQAFIFNAPSGRVRLGLPAVDALVERLAAKGVKKALLRCELYLPNSADGKRHSSADVARASFATDAAQHQAMKLAVLDLIMLDGQDLRPQQSDFALTWAQLADLVGTDEAHPVHRAGGREMPENELAAYFDQQLQASFEGLVVRRLSRPEIVKVKPHLTFDTVVIGYVAGDVDVDGHGEPGVASILCGLVYPQSPPGQLAMQVFARVGSGMDDAQRKALLAQLQPDTVAAPLAMTDSDGRPIVFVKPRHVLEIEGDDIVGHVRNDKENATQFLGWDGQAWTYYRQAHCPRVSFPIFGKLRSDKSPDSGASMAQVASEPVLPPMKPADLAGAPVVLRREVYRKDGKSGDAAVRKLVLVEKTDPEGFPYVVFWTDYSSKRKEPLKVVTQFAATRERADELVAKLLEENITKGFVRVGA
jgi:hypothetical protein